MRISDPACAALHPVDGAKPLRVSVRRTISTRLRRPSLRIRTASGQRPDHNWKTSAAGSRSGPERECRWKVWKRARKPRRNGKCIRRDWCGAALREDGVLERCISRNRSFRDQLIYVVRRHWSDCSEALVCEFKYPSRLDARVKTSGLRASRNYRAEAISRARGLL